MDLFARLRLDFLRNPLQDGNVRVSLHMGFAARFLARSACDQSLSSPVKAASAFLFGR